MENWYHKLHLNEAVQSRSVSKISEILKKATFSIGLTMDCVIRMKLVIPIFHTEFDALQVLYNRFGEIPQYGDFGDFWWLFWRFSLLGSAGGPAKNWCQIFAWGMTDPKKHILAMVFLVLGQSGPQNLVLLLAIATLLVRSLLS